MDSLLSETICDHHRMNITQKLTGAGMYLFLKDKSEMELHFLRV